MAKAKKYKTERWFRIGVEGATTDGRNIERQWLEDMAAGYDPKTYGARINMEHFIAYDPASTFRAYGDVIALKAEEIEINGGKKLALFAQIDPTDDLVKLSKQRQKVYTSMEVRPDFAKTGKAYLTGLAVTDSPASLGTDMLKFNAEHGVLNNRKHDPSCLFTAAEEIELAFEELSDEPGLLEKIRGMFSRKQGDDDARFADVHAAVEEIAGHQVALSDETHKRLGAVEAELQKLSTAGADAEALKTRVDEIASKLSMTPANPERKPATGGKGEAVTDC